MRGLKGCIICKQNLSLQRCGSVYIEEACRVNKHCLTAADGLFIIIRIHTFIKELASNSCRMVYVVSAHNTANELNSRVETNSCLMLFV